MSSTNSNSGSDTVIEISDVWKIFGANADEALLAIKNEGLSKAEVLETFNAVVGVADAAVFRFMDVGDS